MMMTAIQTIALPNIRKGTNILTLTVRFDQKTNLENLYLLGDFGVRLTITVFGNRFNDFGTLHNADDACVWYGPASFRTKEDDWTDCCRVRPVGLLAAPVLEEATD